MSSRRAPLQQSCSPRGWCSPMPCLGLKRAPVSRTCHAHTNTDARASSCCCSCYGVVAVYCGWLWCCYYICLALSSLVTCDEQIKNERTTNDKKERDEFLWVKKGGNVHLLVLVAGKKTKQRKNEKKNRGGGRTSRNAKKAKNFGKIPQHKRNPRPQLQAENG